MGRLILFRISASKWIDYIASFILLHKLIPFDELKVTSTNIEAVEMCSSPNGVDETSLFPKNVEEIEGFLDVPLMYEYAELFN